MMSWPRYLCSVFSLLNALGMFDPPIAPPYASMVIVELFYRDIDEQHFVRFSYRSLYNFHSLEFDLQRKNNLFKKYLLKVKYICHTYTRDNKYGAALSSVKMGKLHCKLIAQVHFHGDFFCTGIQTHYLPPCFLLPGHYLPCRDLHLSDWSKWTNW